MESNRRKQEEIELKKREKTKFCDEQKVSKISLIILKLFSKFNEFHKTKNVTQLKIWFDLWIVHDLTILRGFRAKILTLRFNRKCALKIYYLSPNSKAVNKIF